MPAKVIKITETSFFVVEALEAKIVSDFHSAFFGEGKFEIRVTYNTPDESKFVFVKRFKKETDSFDYFVFVSNIIENNPDSFRSLFHMFGTKFLDSLFIRKN